MCGLHPMHNPHDINSSSNISDTGNIDQKRKYDNVSTNADTLNKMADTYRGSTRNIYKAVSLNPGS